MSNLYEILDMTIDKFEGILHLTLQKR